MREEKKERGKRFKKKKSGCFQLVGWGGPGSGNPRRKKPALFLSI